MNAPAEKIDYSSEPGRFRFGAILGGLLLAGIAAASITATTDKQNRPALESIVEPPTAVSDQSYFHGERDAKSGDVLARYAGRDLTLVNPEKFKSDDVKMRPVGKDEAGQLTIYQTDAAPGALFLKIDRGEYLEVK